MQNDTRNTKQLKKYTKKAVCQTYYWVKSVVFHPKKSIMASGSGDKTVKLWLMSPEFQCISTLEGHSNWVFSVAFHPTKKILASGSGDNTVKLWDYEKIVYIISTNFGSSEYGFIIKTTRKTTNRK